MQGKHIGVGVDVSNARYEGINIPWIRSVMKMEEVQKKEIGEAPDFRKAFQGEISVKMPFLKVIKSGYQPIGYKEHQPENQSVKTPLISPECFILVVRENHRQGHDKDQGDEADVGLRELPLQDVPLQILSQLRGEGTAITTLIGNQIEDAQHEKEDAVDEGRDPVELEAEFQDIKVLIVGCEWEDA